MPEFNLVDQPWLPVRDTESGDHATVGLADAFAGAHRLQLNAGGQEREVLLRLLLAMFDAAAGPQDPTEWGAAWRAETLPIETITTYLRQWRHKLDLFDPVQPVFQCGHLKEYHRDTDVLNPAYLGGTTAAWFQPIGTGPVPADRAVMQLLVLIGYDVTGIKRGIPAGRTYNAWTGQVGGGTPTRILADTLKDELLLNLPPQPRITDFSGHLVDKPIWERDCPPPQPGTERAPTGRRDYLTWPARLMRLQPDPDGNVTAVAWHDGERPSHLDPDLDPIQTWRPSHKTDGTWTPWRPSPSPWLHAWRPVASLLHPHATPVCPAVSHTIDRITEGRLRDDYRLSIAQSHTIYNTHGTIIKGIPQVTSPAGTAGMWRDRNLRTRMANAGLYADQISTTLRLSIRKTAPWAAHALDNVWLDPSTLQWARFIQQLRTATGDTTRDRITAEWQHHVCAEAHTIIDRLPGAAGTKASTVARIHTMIDSDYWLNLSPDSLPGQAPPHGGTIFAAFGDAKTLTAWADDPRCQVNLTTVRRRVLRQGWPVTDAITTPPATDDERHPPQPTTPTATKQNPTPPAGEKPATTAGRRGRRARIFAALGDAKTLAEWADDPRCQVTLTTLRQRLAQEWAIADAITTPSSRGNRKSRRTSRPGPQS